MQAISLPLAVSIRFTQMTSPVERRLVCDIPPFPLTLFHLPSKALNYGRILLWGPKQETLQAFLFEEIKGLKKASLSNQLWAQLGKVRWGFSANNDDKNASLPILAYTTWTLFLSGSSHKANSHPVKTSKVWSIHLVFKI